MDGTIKQGIFSTGFVAASVNDDKNDSTRVATNQAILYLVLTGATTILASFATYLWLQRQPHPS
jgi:hypothetical protein